MKWQNIGKEKHRNRRETGDKKIGRVLVMGTGSPKLRNSKKIGGPTRKKVRTRRSDGCRFSCKRQKKEGEQHAEKKTPRMHETRAKNRTDVGKGQSNCKPDPLWLKKKKLTRKSQSRDGTGKRKPGRRKRYSREFTEVAQRTKLYTKWEQKRGHAGRGWAGAGGQKDRHRRGKRERRQWKRKMDREKHEKEGGGHPKKKNRDREKITKTCKKLVNENSVAKLKRHCVERPNREAKDRTPFAKGEGAPQRRARKRPPGIKNQEEKKTGKKPSDRPRTGVHSHQEADPREVQGK